MKKILLYVAGTLTLLWGISHLFPTAIVVRDFGNISFDNKMIIKMEWITEGMTLIFLGLLTVIITRIETEGKISRIVLLSIAFMLFSMAALSLFTGFRVDFLPFRLCPLIFSASALLILIGIKTNSKA